ncbi:MAG: DNA mismatch endonuclease Vsr [Bacteroidales bacterium]|jgi:DNA mismatch endonuclease (patch repair protein)|nr:DNA mismatch endonuclease Vsr [Bacteroidales bacterium]
MTDTMTPQQRHYCMSQIHSKDTTPEKRVRQWLWQHGYRYRLCVKGVPGKPDIVMRKYRTAIFVNGCFWHGHDVELVVSSEQLVVKSSNCCKIPQTNREFWVAKIKRNQERDQQNYKVLEENGWQVIVLWECQLKPKKLEQTMLQVEIQLHDFYIKTFNHRSKTYIHIEEERLPMVAEEPEEYGQ